MMSSILISAAIFSIWCTILFFEKVIGLSMLLFVAPITYYIIFISEKSGKVENKKAKFLMIPITLLAGTYFIFNNAFFNMINILAIPLLIIIMILLMFNKNITFNGQMLDGIFNMFVQPIDHIKDTFRKVIEFFSNKSKIKVNIERKNKIKKIIKAIIITLPIAVVIIGLLSTADETFGNLFTGMFKNILILIRKIQISSFVGKTIVTIFVFIYLLCFFDFITSRYKTKTGEKLLNKENVKDNFTIKMILGVLNVLYLIFCYIQIKSFINIVNVNYAQFARQGFFQLMIVSVINLFTILISKKRENNDDNKYIKIMCLVMIGFTFIILLSSVFRMYQYESAYGYTLLRLLVYCSLFTEAVLLIPTILYVLDKNVDLPRTYFTIILTVYVCMNIANFDNIIAKRNVDRYIKTGKIDMEYLKENTGTDAINQILKLLSVNEYTDDVKAITKKYLKQQYENLKYETLDLREFNMSRVMARNLIAENMDIIDGVD